MSTGATHHPCLNWVTDSERGSTGPLGKGTQVLAVALEPNSEDTVHGVLKVSWDPKDLNDHSIHDKLQDRDHDPYLQKMAEGAYTYHPKVASTSTMTMMKRICALLIATAVNPSNARRSGTMKPTSEASRSWIDGGHPPFHSAPERG